MSMNCDFFVDVVHTKTSMLCDVSYECCVTFWSRRSGNFSHLLVRFCITASTFLSHLIDVFVTEHRRANFIRPSLNLSKERARVWVRAENARVWARVRA